MSTLGVGRSTYGEVFKLTPPAQGKRKWHESMLHTVEAGVGSQYPQSNVLIAADGTTLFGASYGSAGQSGFYPGNLWEFTP